jgi:isoleucyl-tRNA synthetase
MKLVAATVNKFSQEDIQKIEKEGEISIQIENKRSILQLQDVEISSQDIEGWLVASSGKITVALDITINEDLRKEGVARELVNRIQNLRKESGFEVTDKIVVNLQKDGFVEQAVASNLAYIKTETLTAELNLQDSVENGTEVAFDEVNTKLFIVKH